jgi:hypothetical protein
MTYSWYPLHDGPLAGQEVRIYPVQGGSLPQIIYPHGPLVEAHEGAPSDRHQYVFSSSLGAYLHSAACACLSGTRGVLPDPIPWDQPGADSLGDVLRYAGIDTPNRRG